MISLKLRTLALDRVIKHAQPMHDVIMKTRVDLIDELCARQEHSVHHAMILFTRRKRPIGREESTGTLRLHAVCRVTRRTNDIRIELGEIFRGDGRDLEHRLK